MTITVYTDGACSGNPGPGGWAWAVVGGAFAAGPAEHTTNQRMEIQAVLEAVKALYDEPGPIEVVSDSTYVVNCFRDGWWKGWQAKGWVNSQRKPVANRDLWEPLIDLVNERGNVSFRWVKGHSGDVMNDLVDRLAVQAATTQEARTGGGTSDDGDGADGPAPVADPDSGSVAGAAGGGVGGVGGADGAAAGGPAGAGGSAGAGGGDLGAVTDEAGAPGVARAGVGSIDEAPGGHLVVVLGHRPDRLADPDALRDHLGERLADLAVDHDDLVVVSGLRQGAEMLGAEAAIDAGLPLLVVLPYPDPAASWPEGQRRTFEAIASTADDVVVIEDADPGDGAGRTAALRRRDEWFASRCSEALVVWDGEDKSIEALAERLRDSMGEAVRFVDPESVAAASGG